MCLVIRRGDHYVCLFNYIFPPWPYSWWENIVELHCSKNWVTKVSNNSALIHFDYGLVAWRGVWTVHCKCRMFSTCQAVNNKTNLIEIQQRIMWIWMHTYGSVTSFEVWVYSPLYWNNCLVHGSTEKVETTCSNRDGLRSVIPMARRASELWKCDESGQALRYVAKELNTECVLFDFKSSCS